MSEAKLNSLSIVKENTDGRPSNKTTLEDKQEEDI